MADQKVVEQIERDLPTTESDAAAVMAVDLAAWGDEPRYSPDGKILPGSAALVRAITSMLERDGKRRGELSGMEMLALSGCSAILHDQGLCPCGGVVSYVSSLQGIVPEGQTASGVVPN